MSETTDERTAGDRIYFLRTLRAVRSFRPDPIPQEVVDDVLEVARWSGSASNQQPWEIVVIRDRDTLRSLASVDGYANHLARGAAWDRARHGRRAAGAGDLRRGEAGRAHHARSPRARRWI